MHPNQQKCQEILDETLRRGEKIEDFFTFSEKIGEGTYGKVFLAKPKNRNPLFRASVYALKQTDFEELSTSREITTLSEFRHENIIKLRRLFLTPPRTIYLLLEYCEYDLWTIIHHNKQCKNQHKKLPVLQTMYKSIMHQILTGVEFLHQNLILHRDLKPGNILVTGGDKYQRGRVKIADFGSAGRIDNNVELDAIDPVAVSLWYRAPELLLGAKISKNTDVWSIGCIFAELLLAKPIFINREGDQLNPTAYCYTQLHRIFSVMGLPTLDSWPSHPQLPNFKVWQSDMKKSRVIYDWSLHRYLNHENQSKFICEMVLDEEERKHQEDLLHRLLTMNPETRISCEEALQHSYFTSDPQPTKDVFAQLSSIPYATRGVTNEENEIVAPQPQGNLPINQESQKQGISRLMHGTKLFPYNFAQNWKQATDASRMVSSQSAPYQQQNQQWQPMPAFSQLTSGVHGIGAAAPPLNLINTFQGFPAPGVAFPMQLDIQQIQTFQQHQLMFLQQQEQGRMVSQQEPPSKKPAHQENRKNHPF